MRRCGSLGNPGSARLQEMKKRIPGESLPIFEMGGTRPPGFILCKVAESDVEEEIHNVAVLHHIILPLAADQTFGFGGGHGAAGLEILEGDDLGG